MPKLEKSRRSIRCATKPVSTAVSAVTPTRYGNTRRFLNGDHRAAAKTRLDMTRPLRLTAHHPNLGTAISQRRATSLDGLTGRGASSTASAVGS
jgi:hypothetical protein